MKNTQRSIVSNTAWKRPAPGHVRLYVWEWPVRCSHWLLVFTIISLSITGFYMHAPYVAARGRTTYVMGTMRFVHIVSGFIFLCALIIRGVWFFIGNRWSRWDQFVPTTRKRWNQLIAVGKYYAFLAWSPIRFIGHNPMAGAAYTAVYAMVFTEVVTGMVLFSQTVHSSTLTFLVGWIPTLIDIQWLREIHFLVMFGFWMFFIHHIYTAILVSVEEENGLMDSIFSGYKFIPKAELLEEAEISHDPDLLLDTTTADAIEKRPVLVSVSESQTEPR